MLVKNQRLIYYIIGGAYMKGFSTFLSALLSLTVSSTISVPSQVATCNHEESSSSSSRSFSDCNVWYDSLDSDSSDEKELPQNESTHTVLPKLV